jgi:hypothetical protein
MDGAAHQPHSASVAGSGGGPSSCFISTDGCAMARADVHPAGTISSPSSASMSASIVITNKQASRHVTDGERRLSSHQIAIFPQNSDPVFSNKRGAWIGWLANMEPDHAAKRGICVLVSNTHRHKLYPESEQHSKMLASGGVWGVRD